MDTNNRRRSTNFSTAEINFLLQIVEKKAIINCKQTDRASIDEKVQAWNEVEQEYNSLHGENFRSAKTLKTKYENLKKTAKENFAKEKRQLYATGGGQQVATEVTATDNKILQICQSEEIMGNEALYDDDLIETDFGQEEHLEIAVEEESVEKASEKNCTTSWAKYTPRHLKIARHSALKSKPKKPVSDAWGDVAAAKLEKANLELDCLKKESELKLAKLNMEMEFSKRKQDLEEEKLKLEIAILKKKLTTM